jgi:endogenous inhibitor of DNA gyrase (YacG/DUF329 family)
LAIETPIFPLDDERYKTSKSWLQVIPANMLQAIFVQFWQAYTNKKQHRQCKTCDKWFELVPQDKGRREFCSDACKSKDYRNRKKQLEVSKTPKTKARTPAKKKKGS